MNIPTADRYTGLVGLRFLSYVGAEAGAPPGTQPARAYPDTSLEDLTHLPTLLLNIPTADRYTGLVDPRFLSYVGAEAGAPPGSRPAQAFILLAQAYPDTSVEDLTHRPTLLLNIPTADRYTGLVGPRFLSCVGPRPGAPPNTQPAQAYPDTSLEDLTHQPTLHLNIPTADRYTGLVGLRFLSYVGPRPGAPPGTQPARACPDTSLENLTHQPTLHLNIPTADRYTGLVGPRFLSYVGPRPGAPLNTQPAQAFILLARACPDTSLENLTHQPTLHLNIPTADRYTGPVGPRFLSYVGAEAGASPNPAGTGLPRHFS